MGELSDAMQKLVSYIRSSDEARHLAVSEMNSNTHNLMDHFHLEHQNMSEALKEKLDSDKKALIKDTQNFSKATEHFMNDLRSDLDDSFESLREKLSSDNEAFVKTTGHFMNDLKSDLDDMSDSLKKKLTSDKKALTKTTEHFIKDVRSDFDDMSDSLKEKLASDKETLIKTTHQVRKEAQHFINEIASDHHEAQKLWRTGFGNFGNLEKAVKEFAPQPAANAKKRNGAKREALPALGKRILKVIEQHPDGIKLIDIGNELGVDWRGLIADTKSLIEKNKVEKTDNFYYPKK